jgi:hypothetical protein
MLTNFVLNFIYRFQRHVEYLRVLRVFLDALATLLKATVSFMSVRPSVRMEQLGSQWMDFDEI